jgi:hypothetical protein
MNGLAGQTISLLAHWTIKIIHFIVINTPAVTVWCLTVKTVSLLALSRCQTTLQILLEIFIIQ